jgi:predicted nucleic acid-binding protein
MREEHFLDASAVVRLYAVEPGSRLVKDIVRSASATPPTAQALVCDLSLPETVSALLQIASGPRGPARGVGRAALRHILPGVRRDFVGETPVLSLVPATGCMELAADLVERHRLRVADAVQLAAALRTQSAIPRPASLLFVSEDEAQCRAAEGEGLEVLRPAA